MPAPRKKQTRAPARADRPAVVVLGGAGAMGRITIKDLVETAPDFDVLIADYNEAAAERLARSYKSKRVRAARVDVSNVKGTAKVLRGTFAVINSVHHRFNIAVMEAALQARVHYVDLGGLFHETRKQLRLHKQFVAADRLALLGFGAAPGIVNVLARSAADTMEEVREVHVIVGNVDMTPDRPSTPLGTSYSLATILEEASAPAALFTGGRFKFVRAMSGAVDVDFPAPVGRKRPAYTLHSEVATLPLSYKVKGCQECSFRIAFSEELDERLRFLTEFGLNSVDPIEVDGARIVPQRLLLALSAKGPKLSWSGVPDEYEVLRVIVRGRRDGADIEEVVDCHCPGIHEWRMGVDVDTGCPPSIAVQMLARGEISARGALPGEKAVPAEPFFRELEKRGMKIERQVSGLAPSATPGNYSETGETIVQTAQSEARAADSAGR